MPSQAEEELGLFIVNITPQPITGSNRPAQRKVPSTAQHINFYAYGDGKEAEFTVLAGEGAPTLTGGWVRISKIPRFQRLSVTVPEGYDPYILTIPIMFDGTVANSNSKNPEQLYKSLDKNAEQIEKRIKTLEWMAGRKEHPSSEITGEPPYVEVFTYQGGVRTNLVPTQFQSEPANNNSDMSEIWKAILAVNPKLGHNPDKKLAPHTHVKYPESILKQVPNSEIPLWYITGIAYDTNPLRLRGGDRIRQKATVELTQIVLSPSRLSRVEAESGKNAKKLKTYRVAGGYNTIRKIAVHLTKGRK